MLLIGADFALASLSFCNCLATSASSILFFLASFASACFFANSSPGSLNPVGLVGGFEDLTAMGGFALRLAIRGRGAKS